MIEQSRRILLSRWPVLVVVMIAWLPWWRNHDFLRDLYDYGLVISGVGLIDQGQRPYVDFTTPIQAGFFGLNWLAEKIGGGTYLALARGGAMLIMLMGVGLSLILAQRWNRWAACIVALAVTVASASQHTILWHNALGVFCLAIVVWGTAVAPVLRRQDWLWHAVVAAGLFIGGINKINFHGVALAAALAWAMRAGINRPAGWGRILATCLAWLAVGLALPLVGELAWTGVSWAVWRYNVIGLAVDSRLEPLRDIWSWKFLFTPIHDYYGSLRLPQIGLVGAILSVVALIGCRRGHDGSGRWQWDSILLPVATILASVAAAALLATNQDIAYVGFAAWLVLVTGLWLGFPPVRHGKVFVGGLVLPALIVAVVAWTSAWQGQRSQFGYSGAPRSAYSAAESAGPAFAYLKGLHLPPETVVTMGLLEPWLPEAQSDGFHPVFYGTGMEWLNRFIPGLRYPGQPLWIHWGTTYGPRESMRLMQVLAADARYQVILTTLARDFWPIELLLTLNQNYIKDLLGPVTSRWTRRQKAVEYIADSIVFFNSCGGNVAGLVLHMDERPVVPLPFAGDKIMLGVMAGEGWILLATPTYRFAADAVIERGSRAGAGALHADFKVIIQGAIPEDVRWSARVELPAGQNRVEVPFKFDSLGRELQLRVSVPDDELGLVSAGYRNLQISHAIESPAGAPRLRPGILDDTTVTPEFADHLLAGLAWRPEQFVVRGGRLADPGLELTTGGEVWLHSEGMMGEIMGEVTCADPAGSRPMVRVVWYKGGRLQLMQQGQIPDGKPFPFHAWCAEPGGWFGILLDPGTGTPSAQVRITGAKFSSP